MANIFISYSRQTESMVRTIARDIDALGHTVWFDQELSGGQAWWDQVLARIRASDVFLFALATSSLKSTACKRECDYAEQLGKPILPVLVDDEVSANLLPPTLSQIQFVDHREADRDTAIRLAKALAHTTDAGPLPEPLPEPPDAPVSYLGSLSERVETASMLGFEDQSALVVDLKRAIREPETRVDARTLLEALRSRRDLLATIAEEIDELLDEPYRRASATPREDPTTDGIREAGEKPQREQPRCESPQAAEFTPPGPPYRRRRWITSALIGFGSLGIGASTAEAIYQTTRVEVLAVAGLAAVVVVGLTAAFRIWRGKLGPAPKAHG